MDSVDRVVRSKEEAKASYDKLSSFYDVWSSYEKPYIERGLQYLDVQASDTILEIGCGTGKAILEMAKKAKKVHGIDISSGMLKKAKDKVDAAQDAELSSKIEFHLGDASKLPFPDNTFDGIFMSFTLELFDIPEIDTTLLECKRVLKQGGRLCVVGMTKKKERGAMMKLYEWSHKNFPGTVDCRPIFVQASIEHVGFTPVKSEVMPMYGLAVEVVLANK